MTVIIPLNNVHEGENLCAQRPDLFAMGSGTALEQAEANVWQVVCSNDQFGTILQGLNKQNNTQRLSDYSANKRWEVENRGITSSTGNYPLKTDADSQRKVAILDANYRNGTQTGTVNFKLADGTFILADATMVAGFNVNITQHVKLCYDAEQGAKAGIDNGTVTNTSQVDSFYASIP